MKERCPPVSRDIIALAWKAQLRLHKTYSRLTARGKRSVVATAAVARELLGSSGPSDSASRSAPEAHIPRSASARTPGAVEGTLEFILDERQRDVRGQSEAALRRTVIMG